MLKIYGMDSGSRTLRERETPDPGTWINLENPSDKEVEDAALRCSIPAEMLKAALDDEERARTEIDDGVTLVIVDVPVIDDNAGWFQYSTYPLAILTTDKHMVTVCLRETSVINDFVSGRVKAFDINKKSRFLYQILYTISVKFLHCLRQIDKTSHRVQESLHRSMKNKELIQLLDLEKSLVYFSTSLNANQVVIDKIKQSSAFTHYEEDDDILDDVIIENKQAIEMATIYRDIMSGTMDAFASVISNNQNIVMKLLTALTILLTIPTVISSLWGMNVPVPFQNSPYGFLIICVAVVAILMPIIIIMIKKSMF